MNKPDILKFVRSWFSAINNHAPVESLLAMLNPGDFTLIFPEATLANEEEFRKWYTQVTSQFFDQIHDVKHLQLDMDGEACTVSLLVNWRANTWQAPAAYSTRLNFDAIQSWRIVGRPDGQPALQRYEVVELINNEGA